MNSFYFVSPFLQGGKLVKRRPFVLCFILVLVLTFTTACTIPAPPTETEHPSHTMADGSTGKPIATSETEATAEPQATPEGEPAVSLNKVYPASNPAKLPDAARMRKDMLVVGMAATAGYYNPLYADSTDDIAITGLMYEGLITNDAQGKPLPHIAEKWDITNDDLTYTFTIKKGVTFLNGVELTAKDVAFTYTALCDPGYDGPHSDAVKSLKGYAEYNTGDAASVEGIRILDDYTVSFTLTKARASAIWDFAFGILPQGVFDFDKGNAASLKESFGKPVGCGPYALISANPSDRTELAANPNYFQGTPKIAKIIFTVTSTDTRMQDFNAGLLDIDIIAAKLENIELLQKMGFVEVQEFDGNQYGYIGLNTKDAILSDKLVRQALSYGLDRAGFVETYRQGLGTVAAAPAATVSWAYDPEVKQYPYDPDKAAALLDEAGWTLNANGKRAKGGKVMKLTLTTYTGSAYVEALIALMADNYTALGIDFGTEILEIGSLNAKIYNNHSFQMYNMAWPVTIDPDPSDIFDAVQAEKGGFNAVAWAPEESITLMDEGLSTTDIEKRKESYSKWYALFAEDCPYILLDITKSYVAVSSRVKGVNCSPFVGPLHNAHLLELVD